MTTHFSTRFVSRFVRTKRNGFQFVLCAKRIAQNENRTPGLNSFCAPPKGAHTKRIQTTTACPATNHDVGPRSRTVGPRRVAGSGLDNNANRQPLRTLPPPVRSLTTVNDSRRGMPITANDSQGWAIRK